MIPSWTCSLSQIAVVALALTVALPMAGAQAQWRGGGDGRHGGHGGHGGHGWRGGGWGWRGGGWGLGLAVPPLFYSPPRYYYPPPVYYPPPAYYPYPSG